ncbi:MAG: polyphenol oxidase family protein [Gaiellales bacterium]
MELLEVPAPTPYRVAFSTRLGGASGGPYRSLNLGLLTEDDQTLVVENRRRLARSVGADPAQASSAWQQHGTRVERATRLGLRPSRDELPRCDGLTTDEPGVAMMLVTADCLPIAVWTSEGAPALAVLHAGWRGLSAGIVERGCRALGGGTLGAAIGPAIGPCCYEVGEEVAAPFRQRFGDDVVSGRHLDLPTAAERALLRAGCTSVVRLDSCTCCDERRFFSHRRDKGTTGRQGIIGYVDG